MRCQVKGCYRAALRERNIVTLGLNRPFSEEKVEFSIITGWCEEHMMVERAYRAFVDLMTEAMEDVGIATHLAL